jgi:hypothetical protein
LFQVSLVIFLDEHVTALSPIEVTWFDGPEDRRALSSEDEHLIVCATDCMVSWINEQGVLELYFVMPTPNWVPLYVPSGVHARLTQMRCLGREVKFEAVERLTSDVFGQTGGFIPRDNFPICGG